MSRWAMARPMPRAPPVITAFFPCKSILFILVSLDLKRARRFVESEEEKPGGDFARLWVEPSGRLSYYARRVMMNRNNHRPFWNSLLLASACLLAARFPCTAADSAVDAFRARLQAKHK